MIQEPDVKKRATIYSLCAAAMTMCGLVLGAAPASASIINSPGYIHIQNEGSRKCIDSADQGPVQWRCLNTFNEEWQLVDLGNNNWNLVSHANGWCLTQDGARANGDPAFLFQCLVGAGEQTWHKIELGFDNNKETVQWLNLYSGQCLDLENGDTSDGVPMQVWDCNSNTNNQRWQFEGSG